MAIDNVADQMVETLASAGVKRVYGLVGDSLNGLTEAMRKRGTIDWIHVRHEEAAAFAAGAESQLTGELAVCAGSCGPGNLHLINGLYDCNRTRTPVLAIAAHIPSAEIGSSYFQETHPQELFRGVQRLLRTRIASRADAARPRDRHPCGRRAARRRRHRHPGRRRHEARRLDPHRIRREPAAAKTRRPPGRRGPRRSRRA